LITQLLQKQLQAQLELIYINLISFVNTFFDEVEVEMVELDEISYYIAFTHEHIYIQKHWVVNSESQALVNLVWMLKVVVQVMPWLSISQLKVI